MTETRRLDDQGYAVVLGAMILLGAGILAFTTYQTTIAPSIEDENQARQLETVQDRLSRWSAQASQRHPSVPGTGHTTAIPLAPSSAPLTVTPSPRTLSFEPSTHSVQLEAEDLTLDQLNGTRVGGTAETWISTEDSKVEEVVSVEKLRLRVQEVSASYAGESVMLNVTGANGDHAGDLRLSIDGAGDNQGGGGQGYEVAVRTRGESGDVLFDQPILISSTPQSGQSDPISPFWVDVLSQEYQFDEILDAAQPPFHLAIERDELDSEYSVEYERVGSSTSGSGLSVGRFERSFEGGSLRYDGASGSLGALAMEHGAVVRSQPEGAVFVTPPSFSAQLVGQDVTVHFAWPSLDGPHASVSSGSSVLLSSSPGEVYAIQGRAASFGVNVTTEHPDLWGERVASELEGIGLAQGEGFSTETGASWARVDVWGILDPGPGSQARDVRLDVRSVTTPVSLG